MRDKNYDVKKETKIHMNIERKSKNKNSYYKHIF